MEHTERAEQVQFSLDPDPWWAVVRRWFMVAATLLLGVGLIVHGSWASDMNRLESGIVDGTLGKVTILEDERSGVLEVLWRDPLVARHVVVSETWDGTPASAEVLAASWREHGTETVTVSGEARSSRGEAYGVSVPGWLVGLGIVVVVGTFARIAFSARPLVFSRFGWFWLTLVPFVGALTFWLLGDGSTRHRNAALEAAPRLSGFAGLGAAITLGICGSVLLLFL